MTLIEKIKRLFVRPAPPADATGSVSDAKVGPIEDPPHSPGAGPPEG